MKVYWVSVLLICAACAEAEPNTSKKPDGSTCRDAQCEPQDAARDLSMPYDSQEDETPTDSFADKPPIDSSIPEVIMDSSIPDSMDAQADLTVDTTFDQVSETDSVSDIAITETCIPTSCLAAGYQCGSLADGCGNTLTCGTCEEPLTCGGAGILGQCVRVSLVGEFRSGVGAASGSTTLYGEFSWQGTIEGKSGPITLEGSFR